MKISIITALFNRSGLIIDSLVSVARQKHDDFEVEHIVVDGWSTDGTCKILSDFEARVRSEEQNGYSFRWISEKDNGVYDAMNKGLKMATGDVVAILNSDDFYHRDDTLTKVAAEFAADPQLQVVYGDNVWVNDGALDKVIRYSNGNNWNWFTARCGVMPPHATFFCRCECFERYGYYDSSYKICADFERELMFLVKLKLKSKYLPFAFMTMRKGGISTSGASSYWQSIKECHRACRQVGVFTCWPMQFVKLLVKLPQIFKRSTVS